MTKVSYQDENSKQGILFFGSWWKTKTIYCKTQFLKFDLFLIVLDAVSSLNPTSCVLNVRKPNPLNYRTFFHCTATGSTLMRCPKTMVFDAASSACIKDNTPSSRETLTCKKEGYFAYDNCKKFYRCVSFGIIGQYTRFLFECAEGTLFDESIGYCNHADQVQC